jgi:hypothetical protein
MRLSTTAVADGQRDMVLDKAAHGAKRTHLTGAAIEDDTVIRTAVHALFSMSREWKSQPASEGACDDVKPLKRRGTNGGRAAKGATKARVKRS